MLSLDVLRALVKSQGAVLKAFGTDVGSRLASAAGNAELEEAADKVRKGADGILGYAAKNASQLEIAARDFAYSIGRVAIGKFSMCCAVVGLVCLSFVVWRFWRLFCVHVSLFGFFSLAVGRGGGEVAGIILFSSWDFLIQFQIR